MKRIDLIKFRRASFGLGCLSLAAAGIVGWCTGEILVLADATDTAISAVEDAQTYYYLVGDYMSLPGYIGDVNMTLEDNLVLTGGDFFASRVYVPVIYTVEWESNVRYTLKEVTYAYFSYDYLSYVTLSPYGAFAVYAPVTNVGYYYTYGPNGDFSAFETHGEHISTPTVSYNYDNQGNVYSLLNISFSSLLQHYGYCEAKCSYFMPFHEKRAKAVIASYPNDVYSVGYANGYDIGRGNGYDDGYSVGYQEGYNVGQGSVTEEAGAINTLFGALISVPANVFNGLSTFTIWNTPIISIGLTFMMFGLVAMIVKKVI